MITIGPGQNALIDTNELLAAMHSPNRAKLLIRAEFDERAGVVRTTTADGVTHTFSHRDLADPAVDHPVIDPSALRIIDAGQTLVLGEFEAAADALVELATPSRRRTC